MFYFACVISFIHITKQSPVKFFSAPKRRKSVVKILKLIKHPMSCFEYRAVASLSLLGGQDKIFPVAYPGPSRVGDSPTHRAKMRKKMRKSLRKNKKT